MSEFDVSQLSKESLENGEFPASGRSNFRVHFAPEVHADVGDHAGDDTSVEICGVLVGGWQKDDNGPFAVIRHSIRCDTATSKNAEVTFTHESWAQINEQMDSKYSDQRIIGWYHSHPDFGIFLSDRDMFIQEHFFSGPGQIAYVVDPVRKLEGVFEWREGRAEVASHFWVGDRIVSSAASQSTSPARTSMSPGTTPDSDTPAAAETSSRLDPPLLPSPTVMMAWVAVFLVGYLLSSWNNTSNERYQIEGVIAHYGIWNLYQVGQGEQIEDTRQRVELALGAVTELSREHAELVDDDQRKTLRKKWLAVRRQLADSRDSLELIEQRYTVAKEHRPILREVIALKLAEFHRGGSQGPVLPVPIPVALLKRNDKKAPTEPDGDKTRTRPTGGPTKKKGRPKAGETKAGETKPPAKSTSSKSSAPKSQQPASEAPSD